MKTLKVEKRKVIARTLTSHYDVIELSKKSQKPKPLDILTTYKNGKAKVMMVKDTSMPVGVFMETIKGQFIRIAKKCKGIKV